MTINEADFRDHAPAPPERSARFDEARPFLFEGLRPRFRAKTVRSCFIPMRDGVRLSTDFHIPLGAPLPLPVILVRTPYGTRSNPNALSALLPEQGFVYAVQDVRGRNESEGVFVACTGQDRDDGFDTIEWLSRQDWCNGRIGTIGASYTGETSAKAAATRHPAHRCAVIMYDGSYAAGQTLNGAYLQGGVTLLRMMFQWFREWVPKYSYGPPAHVDREKWFASPYADAYSMQPVALPPVDLEAHLKTLPVFDLVERSGAAPSEFGDMMRRSANPADPYWQAQRFLSAEDRFDVPALYVTGHLERGGSSFDTFNLMRANATERVRQHQYLMLAPTPHSAYHLCDADTRNGARSLGDTRFPYYAMLRDWFGRWLRDDPVDIDAWPRVRYYELNRNAWRVSDSWPPADVISTLLYLRSGGRANGSSGDGVLSFQPARAPENDDEFVYDPGNPVPSEPPSTPLDVLGGGYADRSEIERRGDVLVYTSAPLSESLCLAGPVRATLFVSSSATDTDFSVVLTEVDRSGRSINVTHGISRMRYRAGIMAAQLMQPGSVYEISVDLWHAAIEFPAGHRLRVEVTSSHFPFYDRNLNTGGDNYTETEWLSAHNRIHHGPDHPSALVLPVRRSCKTRDA
jgi:putative CocE/NonD family hydrolase